MSLLSEGQSRHLRDNPAWVQSGNEEVWVLEMEFTVLNISHYRCVATATCYKVDSGLTLSAKHARPKIPL
jgi:hypothetical protein